MNVSTTTAECSRSLLPAGAETKWEEIVLVHQSQYQNSTSNALTSSFLLYADDLVFYIADSDMTSLYNNLQTELTSL